MDEVAHMPDVPLRDYFEARVTALEKASEVSARALDRRLDAMNEIREAMRDMSSGMATRSELDAAKENIEKDLRALREFRAELGGKASQQQANVALALALLSLVMSIVMHFI